MADDVADDQGDPGGLARVVADELGEPQGKVTVEDLPDGDQSVG
ncbi:hypothetical protein [Streptomyces inhibens]|nr:hypothetical protein [Streptomyces inhibens]